MTHWSYSTPEFSTSDPLICRSIQFRPTIWSAFFGLMQNFGSEWSWRQDDPSHATVQEVIDEINNATDQAVFAGCMMLGQVFIWTQATIPDYILLCDGTTYADSEYPDLAAVIHDEYRVDGTHFRVPNLIQRFPLGDSTPAVQGGAAEHTLTVDEIPAHTHTEEGLISLPSAVLGELPGVEISPASQATGSTGGGQAFSIMPPHESVIFVILAAYPGADAPIPPTLLIFDEFTAADGTNINGRSPSPTNTPGHAWSVLAGTWQITGNKAQKTASDFTIEALVIDSETADGVISIDYTPGTNGQGGLSARASDNNNMFFLRVRDDSNQFDLFRREAGGFTLLDSIALPISGATTYALELTLNGTSLVGTLDGGSALSATSSFNQTVTAHGLMLASAVERADGFEVANL